MRHAALLVCSALALVACDNFDDLLCQRTSCDGGAGGDGGATGGGTGGATGGGTGGATGGGTGGATGGGTGGSTGGGSGTDDAGEPDAGGPDGGGADAGVPQGFWVVMNVTALSGNVPIVGFVAGDGFALLVAEGRDPIRASTTSAQTTVNIGPYRPTAVGQSPSLVFLGSDAGVDFWNPNTGPAGGATTAQPLRILGLSGMPNDEVLAVGTSRDGGGAWSALSLAGPAATTGLGCPMKQVAIAATNGAFVHHVVGVGGPSCGAFADRLYAGSWSSLAPGSLSLSPVDAGASPLSGAKVRGATDFSEADFTWQDATGIRMARALSGGALLVAAAPVVPLSGPGTVVGTDVALYNNNGGFVLVLSSPSFGQRIEFTDGGLHPLEAGVPLLLFGAWAAGVPTVSSVRPLRLGHSILDVRLAHSINQDHVYLAGLCQDSAAGPFRAPCETGGPSFFIVDVERP